MTTQFRTKLLLLVATTALLFSAGELRAQVDRDCWYNDKIEACDSAISSGKFQARDLARLYRARSGLLVKKGEVQKAIVDLNAAISAAPSDDSAYIRLGELLEKNGDMESAIKNFARGIDSGQLQGRSLAKLYEARAQMLLKNKDRQKATEDLIAATKAEPGNGRFYSKLAEIYEEDGDTERTLTNLGRAIEVSKDDTETLLKRASFYRRKGEIDLAIADYDQAIKIDPEDADLFNARGTAYLEKGDLEGAIEDFSQAIVRDGKFPSAHINRGDALRRHGDLERAIIDYDAALRMKADNLQSLLRRAIAYRALGQYDRALADLNRILGANNFERVQHGMVDTVYILYERGVTLALKRDFPKSLADLDEVIAKKPEHVMAFSSRAIVRAASNRPEQAIADFSEAIRLDPDNAERFVARAWQSYRMGRMRLALVDAEMAIQLDPDLASAYVTRARIREAVGDHTLAHLDMRAAGEARRRVQSARVAALKAGTNRQTEAQAISSEEALPAARTATGR